MTLIKSLTLVILCLLTGCSQSYLFKAVDGRKVCTDAPPKLDLNRYKFTDSQGNIQSIPVTNIGSMKEVSNCSALTGP